MTFYWIKCISLGGNDMAICKKIGIPLFVVSTNGQRLDGNSFFTKKGRCPSR
jgi:hypothetical protein